MMKLREFKVTIVACIVLAFLVVLVALAKGAEKEPDDTKLLNMFLERDLIQREMKTLQDSYGKLQTRMNKVDNDIKAASEARIKTFKEKK